MRTALRFLYAQICRGRSDQAQVLKIAAQEPDVAFHVIHRPNAGE